jgi:carboxyl-terminal processing protease
MSKKVKNKKKAIKEEFEIIFTMKEVIIIIVVSILFGVIIGGSVTYGKVKNSGDSYLDEFTSTYYSIINNYYDKVSKKDLINAAISGMVNSLDDPYSVYMDSGTTDSFNKEVEGSYVGIGASVSVNEDNKLYVVSMFDDSPAKKAGLKVNDIFYKIDGKLVSKLTLEELTNKITGKVGTKVKLVVIRDNKKINITITRGKVNLTSVTSKVIEQDNKKIGYINISIFASNTYKQFKSNLVKLEKKKIDSLIIDVRDNAGGHLDNATNILELFMKKGTILYQIENKGVITKTKDTTKEKRDYKVVVLINNSSASASELLAAAFKDDYSKATLVGKTTYGKGTVQYDQQLSSGASFKYTTEKWLTPKGKSINKKGVTPDVEIEIGDNYANDKSDANDQQLQKAIEILKESN